MTTLWQIDSSCSESPEAFFARLWTLLAHQATLYTQGDSTSLPAETAQALLDGLTFTLSLEGSQAAARAAALSKVPLTDALAAGQRALAEECRLTTSLWQGVCALMPPLPCRALTDTLSAIGKALGRYDTCFFPQRMDCDIDYQLCCPVDEALRGVRYVHAYLRELMFEADFLRRFPLSALTGLFAALSDDWQESLMALPEPVAVNALGRSLLGIPPKDLSIDDWQLSRLVQRLEPLAPDQLHTTLSWGADRLCRELSLHAGGTQALLHAAADHLLPRLVAALSSGNAACLFRAF